MKYFFTLNKFFSSHQGLSVECGYNIMILPVRSKNWLQSCVAGVIVIDLLQ